MVSFQIIETSWISTLVLCYLDNKQLIKIQGYLSMLYYQNLGLTYILSAAINIYNVQLKCNNNLLVSVTNKTNDSSVSLAQVRLLQPNEPGD